MMKTLIFGEQDSLPLVLRSLLKLRHGQIHFRGEWNGTVGELSDLEATIDIHNKEFWKSSLRTIEEDIDKFMELSKELL